MRYDDRSAAGRLLAEELQELRGRDVVVLGLPRGSWSSSASSRPAALRSS